MTTELSPPAVDEAPDRPTLRAIQAVVTDHVAFERGPVVVPDELVVATDAVEADDESRDALALVVVLALDCARRTVAEVVAGGVVDTQTQARVTALLEHGRALEDVNPAWARLAAGCWVCGCSVDRACDDGCGWAAANLCTRCVEIDADGEGEADVTS